VTFHDALKLTLRSRSQTLFALGFDACQVCLEDHLRTLERPVLAKCALPIDDGTLSLNHAAKAVAGKAPQMLQKGGWNATCSEFTFSSSAAHSFSTRRP
jgi:hypothetical protein